MVVAGQRGLTKGAPEGNAVNHCGQLIDRVVYRSQLCGAFVVGMASRAVGELGWYSIDPPSRELKVVACNEVNPDPIHYRWSRETFILTATLQYMEYNDITYIAFSVL
jgi:hypothetical protein